MNERSIDDLARNAFVDGQLDPAQRQAVQAYLREHPEESQELDAWQRDTQRLRAMGSHDSLPPNPALDPTAVRARLRTRSRRRLAMAASLVMALAIGGVTGWSARDTAVVANRPLPMQDAMQAYRLFASADAPQPDVRADTADLQGWLDEYFANAERLPNLSASGFQPVAARLLATDQGPAAIVIYDNAGQRATFYIRPPGPGKQFLPRGSRRDGDLLARYWSGQGYNYALVTAGDGAADEVLPPSNAVRS
ncbi:anti-sigma factor family protein [Bordetella genomosp. 4]|uniref:Anti-sigma factor n=1 Tax=Bordetella genomosp. 4 TaxID=463044 RepID=A0A261TTG1_9BORD|nr:anti-sigma factor [Bordetella genomosp. 4]OZI44311.1 anti-sigma factor [Bordetella genomosp. 4]OZI52946.1 anti-sigma factor [Bordetella genomosp. 4]